MVKVLYFSAPWCSPCRIFGPALQAASEERGFSIEKVNVETDMKTTQEYGVMSLPTTVWFKDDKPVLSKTGALTGDAIEKVLIALGA